MLMRCVWSVSIVEIGSGIGATVGLLSCGGITDRFAQPHLCWRQRH
jgi:hypothetical protein